MWKHMERSTQNDRDYVGPQPRELRLKGLPQIPLFFTFSFALK